MENLIFSSEKKSLFYFFWRLRFAKNFNMTLKILDYLLCESLTQSMCSFIISLNWLRSPVQLTVQSEVWSPDWCWVPWYSSGCWRPAWLWSRRIQPFVFLPPGPVMPGLGWSRTRELSIIPSRESGQLYCQALDCWHCYRVFQKGRS